MKKTRLMQYALSSLAETSWRRVRGEPLAESWSFRFEWLRGIIR